MLFKIKEFRESLSNEQVSKFITHLGKDTWDQFRQVLDAPDEIEAMKGIEKLKEQISKVGIPALLKLNSALTEKQRDLINNIL